MKTIHESTPLTEAANLGEGEEKLIQVITPGWGSSGYYSPEVCEAAAQLVTVGTHMYLDHPTESDRSERPERSVRDIAAVITEAGVWEADQQRVVAKARLVRPYADVIEDLAPHIGVSIMGSATDITTGEAEGRRGPIIEGLAAIDSVDFVTRAGRGGKVLSVLESARAVERAVGHGVDEATANETREQLQQALRDTFGGEKSWLWVRDFDDDNVWFEHETPDSSGVYALAYSIGDDGVELSDDDPTEVRATTTYVPVTRPGGTSITTEESKEDTPMGNKTIEESEYTRLTEAAGRVETLQQERDTAIAERDTARGELATDRRTAAAAKIVDEKATAASVALTALEATGLMASLPVKEDGALDEDAFTKTVEAQVAEKQKAAGVGTVSGFGTQHSTLGGGTSVGESAPRTRSAWGRETQKGA